MEEKNHLFHMFVGIAAGLALSGAIGLLTYWGLTRYDFSDSIIPEPTIPVSDPILTSETAYSLRGTITTVEDGSVIVITEQKQQQLRVNITESTAITSIDTTRPPKPGEQSASPESVADRSILVEGSAVTLYIEEDVTAETNEVTPLKIQLLE